jgi:hypothetical protein
MRTELQNRCRLLVENRNIIKSEFSFESAYVYPLGASILAAKNKTADVDAISSCLSLLKDRTGIFSSFRGISKLATVISLSVSPNPERKMDDMLFIYEELKDYFWSSYYLSIAASAIADMAQPSQYQDIIQRTSMIYKRMKSAHPLLTSGEDSAFAALLALSGLDNDHIEEEMELCYDILRPNFFSGNAVQSLSHILALGEDPADQKCQKAMDIFEHLKANGYKYGTGYELSTLGTLALLDIDMKTLAADIMDADDFLSNEKGFGNFLGIGSRQRLMYAGLMTMCDYIPDVQTMQTAALSGIVSLVIAQHAAIASSAAAASAAASSSSN